MFCDRPGGPQIGCRANCTMIDVLPGVLHVAQQFLPHKRCAYFCAPTLNDVLPGVLDVAQQFLPHKQCAYFCAPTLPAQQ